MAGDRRHLYPLRPQIGLRFLGQLEPEALLGEILDTGIARTATVAGHVEGIFGDGGAFYVFHVDASSGKGQCRDNFRLPFFQFTPDWQFIHAPGATHQQPGRAIKKGRLMLPFYSRWSRLLLAHYLDLIDLPSADTARCNHLNANMAGRQR